jgi:HSP20 family molecular chaperone IbpA
VRDIDYVSTLALGWPVKPDTADATYENGLLRIEVSFKDPIEAAVGRHQADWGATQDQEYQGLMTL